MGVSAASESNGDRLARYVATGMASLLVATVLAGGTRLWTLSEHCTESRARLAILEQGVRELYERLERYPPPSQLDGNRERLAAVERDLKGHQDTSIEWRDRISSLEKRMHELMTEPQTRPDPFTGTQGRELQRRIDRLEGMRP